MNTFYELKYALNFRQRAGGIMSLSDLKIYRGLLAEAAINESKTLGTAAIVAAAANDFKLADALIDMKGVYVGMIESDIMLIDAWIEKYERGL